MPGIHIFRYPVSVLALTTLISSQGSITAARVD
jgi:hypothetical protein